MADFSTVVVTQNTQAVVLSTVQQVVQVNSSVPGSYESVGRLGLGWMSVKDPIFGAVGDGVTDDTAAIQAALNAVGDDGGVVFFPVGDYVVSGTGLAIKKAGTVLLGGGSSARVVSTATVRGSVQLLGSTAGMTVVRCSGVDDDGTTIMQAGPVLDGIAIVDNLARPTQTLGTMTLLKIQIANRWHLRNCGFFYGAVGLLATKDDTGPGNADCAQYTVHGCAFTFCTTGAWLNTYTGSVDTCWVTGCATGLLIDNDIVSQAVSGVTVRGCKFDIREPATFPGWSPGYGVHVATAQGVTISECLFETQPNTLNAFTTTAIYINGDTANTRVVIENALFSNVHKGVDIVTARYVRCVNLDGRTRAATVVVDSMIAADTVLDLAVFGGKSDTASLPIITLSANVELATIVGYYGTVTGTTTVSEMPYQSWEDGSLRLGQTSLGGTLYREQDTDPTTGAANRAIVYARDDGGGKTQLCVRFNTGVVQVLATEP